MQLAVINQSTVVTAVQANSMAKACAKQLKRDVAPRWNMLPAKVVFYSSPDIVPDNYDQMVILDDADQAGALGYHDETPDGKPYGKVFAKTCLDNGVSVSSCLSHEVCEWFLDPACNQWGDNGSVEYAYELCDPVESDSYMLGRVELSNFVTPAYFDSHGHAPYDFLGKLRQPFSMTTGGYVITRKDGKVSQKFGEAYPTWRRNTKKFPASRTARLIK